MQRKLLIILWIALVGFACKKDPYIFHEDKPEEIPALYKTEKVIIMVMDGPRYSETWGDPQHRFIPEMANKMAPEGAVFTNFYNNGPTYTVSGHTAITTGHYQDLNNGGEVLPKHPSIFQLYQEQKKSTGKTGIIASKGKLHVLGDCKGCKLAGQSKPFINCGTDKKGNGYREDKATFEEAMASLKTEKPDFLLIQFREPDVSGHAGDWEAYLKGISASDKYIAEVWDYVQNDPYYAGKTTIFVTNDHGRHLDGHRDGFVSHGDKCKGCRHINLYASGPDFKKGIIVNNHYHLPDITRTTAELLGIRGFSTNGKVIWEIFEER
jgi:hypothetical protein